MREYKKNKCIKLLKSLNKAHGEIMSCILHKETEAATALIAKCQQAAISCGTMIEEAGQESTEAVKGLEEYCESLYQLHGSVLNKEKISTNNVQKQLSKILDRVSSKIRNDITTDLEVVFLPYKAAMWDSLESVWKKYSEMPNCRCVVIPIPYYDRDAEGNFKEVHYEADLYPKNVPVTHFESYDFETIHPDKIYIHNPYDELNYVTSVHPFFYSSNIKKFTDELIYIPYFVLGDPSDPDNEKYLERTGHFFNVPAVYNADKVIVQSEKMKRAYVNVLTKANGEDTRKKWEDKIYGTGSPKLERIKNLKDEDYEIPEAWKTKVYREDGSKRKIILYNVGLTALLNQKEKMIAKIKYNLEIFKERKEDVVLLWRPHPLIEATLTSMCPQLWDDYKEIVDKYIEEDWGIFDDTPEMDRALAISDAYYGDQSSLVQLYKETGKPIMIQNVDIIGEG